MSTFVDLGGTIAIALNAPVALANAVTQAITSSTIGGILTVSLVGYTPTTSDTIAIFSDPDGYIGTFAQVNDPTFVISGTTYTFQVDYDPNDITLSVVAVSSFLPTVSGVSASSGSTGGGTSVTISGTNFNDATAVTFGGVAASSYIINSGTSITAVSPANSAATDDVLVTNTVGTSTITVNDHFTYNAAGAPTVTSLSASSDYISGGASITINGTNLLGASAVNFGSEPATDFWVISNTQILAYDPANSTTGTAFDVTVTTPTGTSTTSVSDQFTYNAFPTPTVTSLNQTFGSSGGGTSVTITGTNFTYADAVYFGDESADNFTINSSTSITVVVPPETAGSIDVTVESPGGDSALNSGDQYTYVAAAPPNVTSLGTTSGTTAGGTTVVVNGTGFTGASDVFFGSIEAASFSVNSDEQIIACVPPRSTRVRMMSQS